MCQRSSPVLNVDGLLLMVRMRAVRRSTLSSQRSKLNTQHSTLNAQHSTRITRFVGLFVCLASGCVQEMSNQPRVDTYEPVAFFADGQSVRGPVEGTIARGQLPEDSARETGREAGELVDRIPIDVTAALMQRGQKRYGIFCDHCHGPAGDGDGMVVQRGFPAPPSYHIERLQQAPAGHLFGVVTKGHGRMPAFGRRIDPPDRWAIIAYVRALQLSQSAPLSELPESDRTALSNLETDPLE